MLRPAMWMNRLRQPVPGACGAPGSSSEVLPWHLHSGCWPLPPSRSFLCQENLPAPPAGHEVVKFRTRFANKAEPLVETVTLEREGESWRVVGVIIG